MNVYAIWFDLADGREDLNLYNAIAAYLGHFQDQGLIESWTLERRKFGFGPENLGEFQLRILAKDLDSLDKVFSQAATRYGDVERLHAEVYKRVKGFKSGLFRTFPDPERAR